MDKLNILKWYVDVSFAVHPELTSRTGGILATGMYSMYGSWVIGHRALIFMSRKQILKTRNTCEVELVEADGMSVLIL